MKNTLALVLMVFGSFGLEAKNAYEFTNDYQSLLNIGLGNSASRNEIKEAHDALQSFFLNSTDNRRVCASIMGREAYINASKSQRLSFLAPCSDAMSATLKQISLTFRDFRITDLKISGDDKTQDWRFNLKGQSRKIPFTFKVSKRKGEFKILNAVINNVNLGLTFRDQFAKLYEAHNGDYEIINAAWSKPSNPYILPEQGPSKSELAYQEFLKKRKEKAKSEKEEEELRRKIDEAVDDAIKRTLPVCSQYVC